VKALLLAAGVLVLAALLVWGGVLDLGLYGWDTYPLIAAGRVHGLGSLLGTFGEELMEGRFEGGHYWRPLVHLSFAFDHAAFGLAPAGYHATDLGLLVAGALGTFALARRLLGGLAGAWLAAFTYLLHPLHFSLLPLPPRRADTLAVAFTLAALAVHLGGRSRGRSLLAGLLVLAALASKETGVLAVALVVAIELLRAPAGARLRATVGGSWPVLAALAVWAAARTAVLGGLGGAVRGDLLGGVTDGAAVLGRYAALSLETGPLLGRAYGGTALAGLALTTAYVALARRPAPPARGDAPGFERLGPLLILWFSLLVLVTGAGSGQRSWYALGFLPPLAVALGALFQRGLAARRTTPVRGYLGLAVCLALIALQWAGRFGPADPWLRPRAAAQRNAELVERFREAVTTTAPGTTVEVVGRSGKTPVLPPYALEAYAELVLPERAVRVDVPRPAVPPPGPDEVLVLLTARTGGN